MSTLSHTPTSSRGSGLALGMVLLLCGLTLLALNIGYGVPWSLWQQAPWALIVLGMWGASFPNRHLTRAGGVWYLATGLYFICSMYHVFGLGWHSAWPLFIIAAGFGIVLEQFDEAHT